MRRRPEARALVVGLCILIAGCATIRTAGVLQRIEFPLPADSLATGVAAQLTAADPAILIVSFAEGNIESDWLEVPGRTKGILFWRHRWQARAKHVVRVTPSFSSPATACEVEIESEVQERPNSNYDWAPGDPELSRTSEARVRRLVFAAAGVGES